MSGRSPLDSAELSEGLIGRPGTSALMQLHHPQAEQGEDKHCEHNFMGSRVAHDACYKSS